MELQLDGQRVALPRSKKTRALLAYLAANARPHRRERLCRLLWDVTDDPRGALRWSLSRLRKLVSADTERIESSQQDVRLLTEGMLIDIDALQATHAQGLPALDTAALEEAARHYRGEFLEGLELPDFLDFSAWCIDQREQARRLQCELLTALVERHAADPLAACAHARVRAQIDPFNLAAQQQLLALLVDARLLEEARMRFDHAQRAFRQMSAHDAIALDRFWRALLQRAPAEPVAPVADAPAPPGHGELDDAPAVRFVGRQALLDTLSSTLEAALQDPEPQVVLVTGEPGMGKSRLAERFAAAAAGLGVAVVTARAFEAESARPLGPWADCLGADALRASADAGSAHTREDMFAAISARLFGCGENHRGVLLILDDLQWLDRNSAELLHYVVRSARGVPIMVLLLARGGELPDNEAVVVLLKALRRSHALREIDLEPLSEADIATLTGQGTQARRIHDVSAGNPLYALEFLRARPQAGEQAPPTLLELVRERVERLPAHAADVVRWGAILGHAMALEQLEVLTGQGAEELVDALERLEQSALIRIDATQRLARYVFAHDLIREAVYSGLSHPRRRLMHRKVALSLEARAADPGVAAELAHHASLAGEVLLGVQACITAGHQALRLFANADAEALALRGLRMAEDIPAPADIDVKLGLLEVLYSARTPDREAAAQRVRILAERALDQGFTHAARRGFQMVSFLGWESSSLADAHENILQAERVSRLGEAGDRAVALAHAARCFMLLERNLQQAAAFALEADAVSQREGKGRMAVCFALGMIAAHRGQRDDACEAFIEARDLARQQGEHLAEFGALEHHVMLEIDRGRLDAALPLAEALVELGGRVRPGTELPSAHALLAFVRSHAGVADEGTLEDALAALRQADAKFELAFLLTRRAAQMLGAGDLAQAQALGTDALAVAEALGRSSETAHALITLLAVANVHQDMEAVERLSTRLRPLRAKDLSAACRARLMHRPDPMTSD